ncbi:MAG: IS110 family transposase [Candidatus Dormibacteraeota bacterium]|nr:IS110 family transposase [Candidatus Dormibacteraeota bacterium]
MEVLHRCCCGLDVHKRTVVACLIRPTEGGRPAKELRTFGTMSEDLLALADWLRAAGCTQVAMESTGVFWKPVYNLLEGQVAILVANAAHIKAVPGRKTDLKDAEWIADLLQHGLLQPSFIPDRPQRELRDLTRTRTSLIDARTAAVNRLQKVLEDANIKLAGVATDVMGVSGRAMLAALVAGETDPALLAELAKGKLRTKRASLQRALSGRVSAHHRLLLTTPLAHVDFLDEEIAQLSAAIAERLQPFAEEVARLDTIPGVDRQTAEVLLAEIGADMGRFPTAGHRASWAGLCPGNHESGGKRHGGKTRKGRKWLRRALTGAAHGAARTKQAGRTGLADQYRRLVVRRGKGKAAVAVGHRILLIAYRLLQHREDYAEVTPADLDERRHAQARLRAVQQLRQLGYDVTLTAKEDAA